MDERFLGADLASLAALGPKVWEGDGVDVTPEMVLKTLLGELFVEDSLLSDVRDLAEGGFAAVQSAHLTHPNGMKQLVAIKRLKLDRLGSEESLTEFIAVCTLSPSSFPTCALSLMSCCTVPPLQEANLWRKLQSKDIVKLMGVGAGDTSSVGRIRSTFFIVCEFMEGGTLRTIIQRQQMSKYKDIYSAHDVFRHGPSPATIALHWRMLWHMCAARQVSICLSLHVRWRRTPVLQVVCCDHSGSKVSAQLPACHHTQRHEARECVTDINRFKLQRRQGPGSWTAYPWPGLEAVRARQHAGRVLLRGLHL